MNEAIIGVEFIVVGIITTFFVHYRLTQYRKESLKVYRYQFFAIRDRLIRLVAENRVDEDNLAFQHLYSSINSLTPVARPLTLYEAVEIVKSIDFSDSDKIRRVAEALSQSDPELVDILHDMFATLLGLLLFKSFLVRFAVHIGLTGYRVTRALRVFLSPMFKSQNEAYELYREIEKTSSELC